MHSARVLAIEDDEDCRRTLLSDLTKDGFVVELAKTGSEGLVRFRSAPPDVVLVQSLLPDMHGTEVCRRLVETGVRVPIIVLSETLSEDEVVRALESGAADVTKPHELPELKARMRAVLRRTTSRAQRMARVSPSDLVTAGPFTVDLAQQELSVHGRRVGLTEREARLLALLLSPPNRVRTRAELAAEIWPGRKGTYGRALDAHIRRLRLKVDEGCPESHHIVTVHGVGFVFEIGKLEHPERSRSVINGIRRRMAGVRRHGPKEALAGPPDEGLGRPAGLPAMEVDQPAQVGAKAATTTSVRGLLLRLGRSPVGRSR